MFFIKKNEGLYLELCLLLNYIEDDDDLVWLDFYKNKWEVEGLSRLDLKHVVNLINTYLPPEIECDNSGCYIVNNKVEAITNIDEIINAEFVNI